MWIGDDIDDEDHRCCLVKSLRKPIYTKESSIGLNCITSLVHTVVIMGSKIAAKHHGGSCVLELFLAPSKASWPPSTARYDPERISAPR
jgi:hypothetical protein